MSEPSASRVAAMLRQVRVKDKGPNSKSVLDAWIAQAASRLGTDADAGRLGWLIALSVAAAAVQRAGDDRGRQLFLLNGCTLLDQAVARLNAWITEVATP
ncbi:MAG: hypothetical protein B7X41_03235 [Microbacterium sp. 14-71-5]|jgi:hypothetical protein|nr:MAG: hypothetical protein B7X41_03235 [Microbacterium sp. 14-71-5]